MRCFTIHHGSIKRGIKPQVSKTGQVGICFWNKGSEAILPLDMEWQRFFMEGDIARGRLSGGRLETIPIMSADLSEGGKSELSLLPVNLWDGKSNEPRRDRSKTALVLIRPPREGKSVYTSCSFKESLKGERIIRKYHQLEHSSQYRCKCGNVAEGCSTGMEIVRGELSDEGIAGPGGFLMLMEPGSSFRMSRKVAKEPGEFIFQWYFGKWPALKRLTPANWRGQREAA